MASYTMDSVMNLAERELGEAILSMTATKTKTHIHARINFATTAEANAAARTLRGKLTGAEVGAARKSVLVTAPR